MRVRLIALAALAVLATSMIASASASAFTEFTAAESAKLKAKQKGTQVFEAKAGKVTLTFTCTEAKAEYVVKEKKSTLGGTEPEETGAGVVAYSGCTVAGLKLTVINKCVFNFHINETVDINGKACATLEIPSTKCKLTISGEQKGLKGIGYKNEGANLVESSAVSAIKFTGSNGKACGFETESVSGEATYNGSSLVEAENVK